MPFDIPDNWTWIRLNSFANIYNGNSINETEKIRKYTNVKGRSFIATKDVLFNRTIDYENGVKIPENETKFRIAPANKILLCIEGGSAGRKIAFTNKEVCFGNKLACFNTFTINDLYLYNILQTATFLELFKSSLTGIIGGVSINTLKSFLVPLPPLEEQQRIVNKICFIEPLLAKYDSIEKELSALEAEFPEKLKKSILQYAIEGKLVKQDPNDEPASVLLERIKAEKERLIKEGKIKRDKNESYIYQGDDKNYYENLLSFYHDFKTPKNWKCTSLINVCNFVRRGKTPKYSNEKMIPVIAQKCNQKNGILSLNKALYIDPTTISKYSEDKIIKVNDILINSTGGGTVGRVALVDNELFKKYKTVVADSHITIVRVSDLIVPKYVYFFLKSPLIFDHVEQNCEGSTNQMELNAKTIMSYPFPTPPLNEQRKIARKVTVLFVQINS